jgi:hypothetical protein
MARRIRRFVLTVNALLVALLVVGAQGCMPSADGAGQPNKPKGKGGRKGGATGRRAGAGPGAMAMQGGMPGGPGAMRPGSMAGLETASGYIMKGTDMLIFWPCGKSGYYFMVPSPLLISRIAQDYKFATKRPYATMYAELKVRYVDDSISRGTRSYSRYVQVMEYVQRSRRDATCPAPKTQLVSDEMNRLEAFRVDYER